MTSVPDPSVTRTPPAFAGDPAVAALTQPTRRRIVETLASSPAGMTPFEIAEAVALHHNAVRRHLETLAKVGVVVSERDAPAGRAGRPSRRYRVVAAEGLAEAGHRELARMLVELVRRAGASESDVEAFGREEGRVLARGQIDPQATRATFARLGFAPDDVTEDAARRRGEQDLRLRRCPFAEAVMAEGGHLVCALHRGLTLGALDVSAPDAHLAVFEIRDPIAAGCRVVIRGLSPSAGADQSEPV